MLHFKIIDDNDIYKLSLNNFSTVPTAERNAYSRRLLTVDNKIIAIKTRTFRTRFSNNKSYNYDLQNHYRNSQYHKHHDLIMYLDDETIDHSHFIFMVNTFGNKVKDLIKIIHNVDLKNNLILYNLYSKKNQKTFTNPYFGSVFRSQTQGQSTVVRYFKTDGTDVIICPYPGMIDKITEKKTVKVEYIFTPIIYSKGSEHFMKNELVEIRIHEIENPYNLPEGFVFSKRSDRILKH